MYAMRAPSMKISSTSGRAEQIGERPEVGDRTHDPLHDRGGIGEPELLTEPGPALVLVDGALGLDPHFGEVAIGSQPTPLDRAQHVAPDRVVRVVALDAQPR